MPYDWQDNSEAHVRPPCHPTAPAWVKINRAAQITMTCARCGEVFLKIVAKNAVLDLAEVRLK